ncbi:putative ribonuclease H-like domain-containing protein [Tanacetum coccineum]
MVEKPVLNNKRRVTGQREVRLVWNNAQRVNHQNKLTHPYPKRNFVPTEVATKANNVTTAGLKAVVSAAEGNGENCEMKDIRREFSVARTPQQNGVAERKNKTLIEAARTMLVDSKLPTTF